MDKYNQYNREIPDDCSIVHQGGQAFLIGNTFETMRLRFDPMTLALAAMAAGTGMQIAGTLKQGDQAEDIANARAAIDMQHAQAVDEATNEKAKILEEKRLRAVSSAKSAIATGNVRLGGNLDLTTMADINATFWAEKNFSTISGRTESSLYRSRAGIEIAGGKAAKKQSKWAAISQGISGFGSIAMMGSQAGLFSRSGSVVSPDSALSTQAGRSTIGSSTRNFPQEAFN